MKICKVFAPCDRGHTCCCCECDEPDRLGCICTNVQEGASGICEHVEEEAR